MTLLKIPPQLDANVIVVGAGPAGAAAAAHLAQAGVGVLLLDRQAFPRDKVCGDFVGPSALVELEALGVTTRQGYRDTNIIREAAIHLDGEELLCQPLPEVSDLPSYGRVIPRLQLDAWLLDAARESGVTVIEGARVTGFELDADRVTVTAERGKQPLQWRAQLLIGADGSSSTVARLLRGAAPPDGDRIIAVRAYYEGLRGREDRADLYFAAESFPGYYWLFPTGRAGANVGVGMVLETLPKADDHLRELLLRLVQQDPALGARLQGARLVGRIVGWPLSTYDARLPIVGARVMLIGDAAGFINPLNGEGIQYALLSARWAAEVARECIADGDCGEPRLRLFAELAERELRYDMALAGLVVQAIRNRHLTAVWLQALRVIIARARVDRAYAQTMGGILAGLAPARDVLNARVLGRTADQALYSLGLGVVFSALKGPAHLKTRGALAARAAAAAAIEALRDPAALADWLAGLARQSGELALQFGTTLWEGSRPAPAPGTVRLKIPFDHV